MSVVFPDRSTELAGQVALVTGASAGLGKRFAECLAAHGAKVAVSARRKDKLELLAAEIREAGGVAEPFALDVADAAALTSIVPAIEAKLGPVTILVNNAGVSDAQRATKMSVEMIDRVIGVNLRAPYILSCEVARRLIALKQPGRIVNIASLGAFMYGGNGTSLYSITKASMGLTETLAVEWSAFNINVNAIAPGAFHSEMMDGMIARVGDISGRFPRKRIFDPRQLDSTLLYLVSSASESVTGAGLKVDDG
jgi:NAD(P)-dependent dehydrogenase (short-subunit alcohol dehydrogenase family)